MATTFETKTWVDRVSEYPARRTLTDTSGNATVYTVTRNEGTVSEEGDAFSAENMNDLESRIATAVDAKLDGTTLVSDYDTAVTTTTTGTAPDCTVIAEMYQNFTAGCSVIAAALNSAGVATASNASPSVMAAAIATVSDNQYTSGYAAAKVGTANASHVLSGYTFTNAANVGATGNMSNRGNVTITLNCGNSYTITNGYHGGGGTVTANSLSSQTAGNITAARVLNGYVGWANGTKYTGSMNNWGSNTVTMSSNTATLSAGYYSSISINATSRYTAGYNARTITTTTIGTYNSSANLSASASSVNIANYATFNVANSISSYANLSASNLYIANVVVGLYHEQGSSSGTYGVYNTSRTVSISYNASNGIANVSGLKTASLTQDSVYTSIAYIKSFNLRAKYLA